MDETSLAHLLIDNGLERVEVPLIGRTIWNIGRVDDCQIPIKEPWISRNHAMIQRTEEVEYYLIDLGSRNGTFVNGRRVTIPVLLQTGDKISFGDAVAVANPTVISFSCPLQSLSQIDLISQSRDLSATVVLNEQRLITVLVMDIRDFTKLSREMDSVLLSKMIGTWFREAGAIIQSHGSKVDKYIGDAVMAVWIHAIDHHESKDIVHICTALRELWKMTQELQKQFSVPFPLRVGAGVNTGNAMVGNKGTSDRPDYTPLGDTVNAAFRLESSTKQIQQDIAIGETTFTWLQDCFSDQLTPFRNYQLELKGYEGLTTAFACSFEEFEHFLARQKLV